MYSQVVLPIETEDFFTFNDKNTFYRFRCETKLYFKHQFVVTKNFFARDRFSYFFVLAVKGILRLYNCAAG